MKTALELSKLDNFLLALDWAQIKQVLCFDRELIPDSTYIKFLYSEFNNVLPSDDFFSYTKHCGHPFMFPVVSFKIADSNEMFLFYSQKASLFHRLRIFFDFYKAFYVSWQKKEYKVSLILEDGSEFSFCSHKNINLPAIKCEPLWPKLKRCLRCIQKLLLDFYKVRGFILVK